jgi:sortase A
MRFEQRVPIALLSVIMTVAVGCSHRKAPAPKAQSPKDIPTMPGMDLGSTALPPPASPSPASTPSPGPTGPIAFPAAQPKVGQPIGEIDIPKIGLVHKIYQGFELAQIDFGPGHWPGSPLPGQPGNVVFAGHRVTHSHPFLDLDKMAVGDQIVFKTPSGQFTYEMTQQMIVKPTDVQVLNATPDATVTLIACHPKHSALQRIVVRGRLVSSTPPAAVSG